MVMVGPRYVASIVKPGVAISLMRGRHVKDRLLT
jgi:hypothetical protein